MTTKLLDILEQNLIESDKSVNSYISLINSPLFLIDPNFMFKQPKSSQEETILENIKNHTEMMQQLIDILKVKKETITKFLKDNKKKFTITQFTLSQLDGKVTALKKIYKIITKLAELTEKKNITISGVFDSLKESNTEHLKFLERLSAIGSSQGEIIHLVNEFKSGIKLSKKSTIKQIKEIIPNLEYILNELKDYDSSLKIQKIINTLPETNFDEFEKFIIDNKLHTSPLNKTLINLVNINRFCNLTLILKKIQKLNISILKIDSLPKNKNFILYRESLTSRGPTLLIKMEVINTDNVPLTELKHVLLLNNGKLIVANDENELLESYKEIKSKEADILFTPVNFLMESSNFKILDNSTEYNLEFKNTFNCYGKVLSRKNDRMANILNTIKYTFYHDTKFFIEDFIKIRDDSILVKNNTLLNLLSLSNDYRLIIDGISKKNNQDISTLIADIANQPFFKEIYTYFKKQELFNYKVKDMPRPSKIVNYLTYIDFEDDLKKEISIFINNFAEMVKKISNANSMIILMALFNMANDVTNTNIFCYDLINSREFNAVEYQKLVSSIINQERRYNYDIHQKLFNQHYTYNSGNLNNNIKLPRLSWTHFDSVGTSAHCSETTLFQLINWLILDYSKSNVTKKYGSHRKN